MSAVQSALLADRGVVSVSGLDAEKLLQGLLTNDVAGMAAGQARFAGLLTPQGKITCDFLIAPVQAGFLLDVPRAAAADLVKRLQLYRLRSKVEIADVSKQYCVLAVWGEDATPDAETEPEPLVTYRDPRLADLGLRRIALAAETPVHSGQSACEHAYHAHRIALGVPEGARDYVYGDAYPHEALYDQLNGVSFAKGCYVGQEIVSRMQHRGTARKRIVMVEGSGALPATGTDIVAGDVAIGTLGSTAGALGLALVRLDRAAEFAAKGVGLAAGGVAVTLHKPPYATFAMASSQPASAP